MEKFDQPVLAVHAPTLLVTRGVFGVDPWDKVDRSIELAHYLEAPHRGAAPALLLADPLRALLHAGVAQREATTGIHLAVENMFTWRPRHAHSTRDFQAYSPTWDPVGRATSR